MKHRRTLTIDHLEDKVMLSHVAIHHPVHSVVVHHQVAPHLTKALIKADLAHSVARPVHGQHLALGVRPSLARIHTFQASSGFGGGTVDTTIPFILATDVGGVAQNALNFTSNTYQNMLFGTGGWKGIQQIASDFNSDGDKAELASNLTDLAQRVPYGVQMLLPTWEADLQVGSSSAGPQGSQPDFGSGNGVVADILFQDLQAYLAAGLGTSFNILKSVIDWNNSDDLLSYNGTVEAMGTNNSTVTPSVS